MSGAYGSLISRPRFRTYSSELARLETACGDMGEQQVKNIARPVHVWRIRLGPKPAVSTSEPLPLPDKPSIAVLPFANLGGGWTILFKYRGLSTTVEIGN